VGPARGTGEERPLAALLHACRSHSQPFALSHCSVARCPPYATQEHMSSSKAQPFACVLQHGEASFCSRVEANVSGGAINTTSTLLVVLIRSSHAFAQPLQHLKVAVHHCSIHSWPSYRLDEPGVQGPQPPQHIRVPTPRRQLITERQYCSGDTLSARPLQCRHSAVPRSQPADIIITQPPRRIRRSCRDVSFP
jgi:hypothetical protein